MLNHREKEHAFAGIEIRRPEHVEELTYKKDEYG